MPHCIVEYSKGLERQIEPFKLIEAVYQGALGSGLFEGADIKTRAIHYSFYQVGADKSDFIHVSVRILSGRSDQQKKLLSSKILEQLCSLKLKRTSLTVEVIDIDRGSYAKHGEKT